MQKCQIFPAFSHEVLIFKMSLRLNWKRYQVKIFSFVTRVMIETNL